MVRAGSSPSSKMPIIIAKWQKNGGLLPQGSLFRISAGTGNILSLKATGSIAKKLSDNFICITDLRTPLHYQMTRESQQIGKVEAAAN